MTTVSLVALLLSFLLLAVRYQAQLREWSSQARKSKHDSHHEYANTASDFKRMAPYPAQPIRGRERYRVMMDIRKLDSQNWLTLDKNYMEEHRVRDYLLSEKRDQVLRCLPESVEACREALEEVSSFLCQQFPNMFHLSFGYGKKIIRNCMTGEMFEIGGSVSTEKLTDALEAAVRLTMEDLSILMKNEDGEYYLYVLQSPIFA